MLPSPSKLTIYLGFDSRERPAYDVARSSLLQRTHPRNAEVVALQLGSALLAPILKRPIEKRDGKLWCPISEAPMATEFAISRFCVPFLQKKGWALFADCDILCRADIAELFALADDRYAVMAVKHGKLEGAGAKMDGQVQTVYPRSTILPTSVSPWTCSTPGRVVTCTRSSGSTTTRSASCRTSGTT